MLLAGVMSLVSCSKEPGDDAPLTPPSDNIYVNRCDFENRSLSFHVSGDGSFKVVSNPSKSGIDRSAHCGRLTTGSGELEYVYCDPLNRKFDFTRNAPVFSVKVFSPKSGAKVVMKLLPKSGAKPEPVEAAAITSTSGEWEELFFDFRRANPDNNVYQKFSLFFDAGVSSSGDSWYFDDVNCPSDDLTDICLFKRYGNNPVFRPDGSRTWRGDHMANAAVLSPKDSPDGNWWLYLRGSGSCPGYCDQIGLYQQSADDFHPFGPWNEYAGNPVLPIGPAGSYDGGFLLDTAPVVGGDGKVYVYYNGQTAGHASHGLCVRYSENGYDFTRVDAPLLPNFGCSDAVYHDGKYYIFYGGGNPCKLYVKVTSNPLSFENAETYPTIPLGGGPSNFDSMAINGSMIFRLDGVDKWFSTYQGSSGTYDFPDRFHVAMSDDLIHWTKVDNEQPLFTRGSAGAWDQGAVWFCEIFEHEDMLYMYYEGWGKTGYVDDRDEAYFPGRSQVGAAYCPKDEFLKWCGLK